MPFGQSDAARTILPGGLSSLRDQMTRLLVVIVMGIVIGLFLEQHIISSQTISFFSIYSGEFSRNFVRIRSPLYDKVIFSSDLGKLQE